VYTMRDNKMIRVGYILWIILLSLGLGGCQKKNAYIPPPPSEVTVGRPVEQEVTDYAEFTGITEGVKSLEVRARVEGYLKKIHFKDGDRVKEGDLLFTIEQEPYEDRLAQARATMQLRQAELKLAEVTLKRKEAAHNDNAISEIEVIEARAKMDIAAANVAAAQANVETAELNLSYTKVQAAIRGRISRHLVDVGNLVGAGEKTLLATIVQDDQIYTYFNVSERELLRFRRGSRADQTPLNSNGKTPVFLSLAEATSHIPEGFLDYVDNRVDSSTGTIQVRGIFSNNNHTLLPGLFARIRVPLGEPRKALLVPERSIGADQQGRYVFVVKDDNTVEYRPIEIGAKVNNLRVIEKGLKPDDRIVLIGIQRARPGATVNPVEGKAQKEANVENPKPKAQGGPNV